MIAKSLNVNTKTYIANHDLWFIGLNVCTILGVLIFILGVIQYDAFHNGGSLTSEKMSRQSMR